MASSDKQLWSEESNANNHLTCLNESVVTQENFNSTNEHIIKITNNIKPQIQNESTGSSYDQLPSRFIDKYIKPQIPCLCKRYTIAILTFFGFVVVYSMQCTIYNESLEQIIHTHIKVLDVIYKEQNQSLEILKNDYNAIHKEFYNIQNSSLKNKKKFMYYNAEDSNLTCNESFKKKFNTTYSWRYEFSYLCDQDFMVLMCNYENNENLEEVINVTSSEEYNYAYNLSEKSFDCFFNDSISFFLSVYENMISRINLCYNQTIKYAYFTLIQKKCDQDFNEVVLEIKNLLFCHEFLDANKIAELITLNCKKIYWQENFIAFVFGNALAQIPGGVLAYLYPAHKVFGAAIGLSSVINLCTTIIYNEITSKYVILFFQGLVQGVMYPACYGIWRYWAPPFERSRLSTISFCGIFVGIVIGIPLTDLLKNNFGWKMPFYIYSIAGILWYIVWTWLSFEKPSHHPVISEQERNYIQSSIGFSSGSTKPSLFKYIPWKHIFTSQSVLAILVADFCHMWNSVYILLHFAKEINLPTSKEKFYIVIPFFFASIIIILGGVVADYIIRKPILCTTNVRKIFTCSGFLVEAFIILISTFSSISEGVRTNICLISSITFSGLAFSGFYVNHLDIAPRYASILWGITNSISLAVVIILFRVLPEYVFSVPEAFYERLSVLQVLAYVTICLQFVGDVFYSSYASGEQQPWAEPVYDENMIINRTEANEKKKLPPRGFRILL